MKLDFFEFIDECIEYYNLKNTSFQYAEGKLVGSFEEIFEELGDVVVSIQSRIKTEDSLKEKLIRNEFYLKYRTAEEAIEHLSDLIGITIQCRFIRNEAELYNYLFRCCERSGSEYYKVTDYPDIRLNLRMPQPQLQRNGFTIYRIDGYYEFNESRINFELQIKSLVHSFWSEIEHEVVYKNPDFVMFDQFNRNMLGAIRDNLDIVDRQLEIMYNEISSESRRAQIGMDEKGFKVFVTRSINDLVNRNMKDSVGFTTDFKKCSAMISQYIYVEYFMEKRDNRVRMIDYLEVLSYLDSQQIDFGTAIHLKKPYSSPDPFCQTVGKFFEEKLNSNFQWHVFFAILFAVEDSDNDIIFDRFCQFLQKLLIQPGYYLEKVSFLSDDARKEASDVFRQTVAEALISSGNISMIHEDMLLRCVDTLRTTVDRILDRYENDDSIMQHKEEICREIFYQISNVFR